MGARAAAPQRGTSRGGQRGSPAPAARGRGSTAPVARGGSARTFHHEDKNVYVHLLGHLKKLALLPVVVFTFSKRRCEDNAATLTNADLSTAAEKSEVHVAVERALSRLKGTLRDVLCASSMLTKHFLRVRQKASSDRPYA
jgi:antiviral helicase SKI2